MLSFFRFVGPKFELVTGRRRTNCTANKTRRVTTKKTSTFRSVLTLMGPYVSRVVSGGTRGGAWGGQMPPQLEALPPHLPPQSEWDFFFFFFLFFFFFFFPFFFFYLCRKSDQSPI